MTFFHIARESPSRQTAARSSRGIIVARFFKLPWPVDATISAGFDGHWAVAVAGVA